MLGEVSIHDELGRYRDMDQRAIERSRPYPHEDDYGGADAGLEGGEASVVKA